MNGLGLTSKTNLNLNIKETEQTLESVYVQNPNVGGSVWKAIRWEVESAG